MQTKTIYVFEDITETGVDIVPVESLIQVNGGAVRSTSWYYLLSVAGFSSSTTIAEMLANPSSYTRVGTSTKLIYDYSKNDMHFKIKG